LRWQYHQDIERHLLYEEGRGKRTYPNLADGTSASSVRIARILCENLHWKPRKRSTPPQQIGKLFEKATRQFLQSALDALEPIRPGPWIYPEKDADKEIDRFVQYRHLHELYRVMQEHPELRSALGQDYLITPDIVVARQPLRDEQINARGSVILPDDRIVQHTPLRERNRPERIPILHASISCKWTIRSDRAQSVRAEALNLLKNRKGHLPHIVVVTAEPLPTRIASLAYGTGELDCVYHIALHELVQAVGQVSDDQSQVLLELIHGDRLRDISDLPFDLAT
jgi:hypothetical protein